MPKWERKRRETSSRPEAADIAITKRTTKRRLRRREVAAGASNLAVAPMAIGNSLNEAGGEENGKEDYSLAKPDTAIALSQPLHLSKGDYFTGGRIS